MHTEVQNQRKDTVVERKKPQSFPDSSITKAPWWGSWRKAPRLHCRTCTLPILLTPGLPQRLPPSQSRPTAAGHTAGGHTAGFAPTSSQPPPPQGRGTTSYQHAGTVNNGSQQRADPSTPHVDATVGTAGLPAMMTQPSLCLHRACARTVPLNGKNTNKEGG